MFGRGWNLARPRFLLVGRAGGEGEGVPNAALLLRSAGSDAKSNSKLLFLEFLFANGFLEQIRHTNRFFLADFSLSDDCRVMKHVITLKRCKKHLTKNKALAFYNISNYNVMYTSFTHL